MHLRLQARSQGKNCQNYANIIWLGALSVGCGKATCDTENYAWVCLYWYVFKVAPCTAQFSAKFRLKSKKLGQTLRNFVENWVAHGVTLTNCELKIQISIHPEWGRIVFKRDNDNQGCRFLIDNKCSIYPGISFGAGANRKLRYWSPKVRQRDRRKIGDEIDPIVLSNKNH